MKFERVTVIYLDLLESFFLKKNKDKERRDLNGKAMERLELTNWEFELNGISIDSKRWKDEHEKIL